MLSNIFLKFSEFSLLDDEQQPFSDRFVKTAPSVLTNFLSTEEIVDMPLDALIRHICEKGRNHFQDPEATTSLYSSDQGGEQSD